MGILDTLTGRTTFSRGGVHPPDGKEQTRDVALQDFAAPERVTVPLLQHIGKPAAPVVGRKDEVKKGQLIGEAQGFISANVHSPVSGKVKSVGRCVHNPTGRMVPAVVIDNDGEDEWADGCGQEQDVEALDVETMVDMVQDAGVVGLGGAGFPSHVKLSPPPEKPVTDVFINGAECEPFVTCDYRLMMEKTEDIVDALRLMMRMVDAPRGHIGIEENKPEGIEAFRAACADEDSITVHALAVQYPQGAEKQLIEAVTGREVPDEGGLPADVGALVHNPGTALAIRDAIRFRIPLIQRAVTVTGPGAREAGNWVIPMGTSVKEVLDRVGGMSDETRRVILGGPMMGVSQGDLDVPLIKGNNCILLLEKGDLAPQRACIRCGRCVERCPLGLVPSNISIACENEDWDAALEYDIQECMECGCCAYICPAKRKIVHQVKFGKAEIAKRDK